ncbi:MAG: hypothetical protein ABIL62_09075 [Planctomycetota bacterium]
MRNDSSSGFRDSSPSANSGLKVSIPYEHDEQGSSIVDKKRRTSEPVRIGEILPAVMLDIEKRMQRHYRVEVGIDIADYTIKE